jgi:hypothetical protein
VETTCELGAPPMVVALLWLLLSWLVLALYRDGGITGGTIVAGFNSRDVDVATTSIASGDC